MGRAATNTEIKVLLVTTTSLCPNNTRLDALWVWSRVVGGFPFVDPKLRLYGLRKASKSDKSSSVLDHKLFRPSV
jgi:hypothetical protein